VDEASSQQPARLLAVGVSHHHAPLEVRERLYLQDGHAAELAAGLGEAVVISTCNRTEIYAVEDEQEVAPHVWAALSARLGEAGQEKARMARVAETWERVNRAANEVDTYNLERKPLVFAVFGALAEAARP